jgi:hypothetical protein
MHVRTFHIGNPCSQAGHDLENLMHFHPDIILFAILLFLILGTSGRIIYLRVKKRPINYKWTESIKHLGQISLAFGFLLQLVELSTALAHTTNLLTTEEIAKGFRSTLFSTMHGLLVYIIAMILFAVLKLTVKNESD